MLIGVIVITGVAGIVILNALILRAERLEQERLERMFFSAKAKNETEGK